MDIDDISEAALRRRRGEKWSRYGSEVLPAWVADMDFPVAEPVREAIEARVDAGDLGYPLSVRHSGMRELFCQRVEARFGWAVRADDVLVINDVVQGLYLGLQTLTERAAGVIINTPIYPPFMQAVSETQRRTLRCPLVRGAGRYEIDFDALEAAAADASALMFCNPHNPCGRAFEQDELERVAAICCRHDLVVLSDEIHADLVLDDKPHVPLAAIDAEVAARTVTLMSASKAFNIAGLCLAFAHFGSAGLRRRFESMPAHVRGGTNALSLAAVRAAWTAGQPWQDTVLERLRANRARVTEFVATRWPAVRHHPPEATYLAWLDLGALGLEPTPQRYLLEHARVALSEGSSFGVEGDGFVRLNFATSPAILDAILARLDTALAAVR
ncbi:MAG: MalY/PatB family protein [Gammaproteobacteria bacterium]